MVVEMARGGRFAEIRELFVPALRPMVSPAALQATWEHELDQKGEITAIGEPRSEPSGPITVVRLPISCEHDGLTLVASVSGAGLLAGLQLAAPEASEPPAPWEPPDYADPASFDEEDVTVGDGPLAVPGTLSLPRRPGPHLAVVVLAGSGPLDRDETMGRNKPLRDLAWGLATCGVGVLRFDKVTFAHPGEVKQAPGFTLADEYLPHATAAVELLRHHLDVDPTRVFLLGHSLGGTVAPSDSPGHERLELAGLHRLTVPPSPGRGTIARPGRIVPSASRSLSRRRSPSYWVVHPPSGPR